MALQGRRAALGKAVTARGLRCARSPTPRGFPFPLSNFLDRSCSGDKQLSSERSFALFALRSRNGHFGTDLEAELLRCWSYILERSCLWKSQPVFALKLCSCTGNFGRGLTCQHESCSSPEFALNKWLGRFSILCLSCSYFYSLIARVKAESAIEVRTAAQIICSTNLFVNLLFRVERLLFLALLNVDF